MMKKLISTAFIVLLVLSIFAPMIQASRKSTVEIPKFTELEMNYTGFWSEFDQSASWTLTNPEGKDITKDMTIVYSDKTLGKVKLTFNFLAIIGGTYTLSLDIKKDAKSLLKGENKATLTFKDYELEVNWSDTKSDPKIKSTDKSQAKKFKLEITRECGMLELVSIDPYLIASGVGGEHYYQRHVQYMEGRYWIFYSDGTDAVVTSSADGVTDWSGEVLYAAHTAYTSRIDTFWDGTYIHVAIGYIDNCVIYRRGLPVDDGSITWSAAWQTALNPATFGGLYSYFTEPAVTVDSTGHPWILANAENIGEKYLYVTSSSTTDGTWVTVANHSTELDNQVDTEGAIIPLSNGDMYVIWAPNNADSSLKGRKFIAATNDWGGAGSNISPTTVEMGFDFNAVVVDDVISVIYTDATTARAYYFSRSVAGTWSTFTDVSEAAIINTPTLVLDPTGVGEFWVLWTVTADTVFARHYDGSNWSEITTIDTLENDCLGSEASYRQEETNWPNANCALLYYNAGGLYVEMLKVYLIGLGTFEIHEMDGCGNWVTANKKYYTFSYNLTILNTTTPKYVAIQFNDTIHEVRFSYNFTEQRFYMEEGDDYVDVVPISVNSTDTFFEIQWGVLFTSDCFDDVNVDVGVYADLDLDGVPLAGWGVWANYFNIYNQGGSTTIKSTGNAGRSTAGGVFDLYAYNVSSVRANMTWQKLQSWRGVFFINTDHQTQWDDLESEDQFYRFGYDYCYDDVWVEGLNVQIELVDGYIDAATNTLMYLTWNVTWFDHGVLQKSFLINSYPRLQSAGDDVPAQTGFIVDLWVDKKDAGTTVSGRVTAMEFGIEKTSVWWKEWLTGGEYAPILSNNTQAMVSVPFTDSGNTTDISARDCTGMHLWAEIEVGDIGASDAKFWFSDFDTFDISTASTNMIGLDTPAFVTTVMPSLVMSGVFGIIIAGLTSLVGVIMSFFGPLFAFVGSFVLGTIDGIISLFGGPPGLATAWWNIGSGVFTYVVSGITWIFYTFQGSCQWIFSAAGDAWDSLVLFWGFCMNVLTFLSGTAGAGGDIIAQARAAWTNYSVDKIAAAIVALTPLWIVLRYDEALKKKQGRKTFTNDKNIILWVVDLFVKAVFGIVSWIIDRITPRMP